METGSVSGRSQTYSNHTKTARAQNTDMLQQITRDTNLPVDYRNVKKKIRESTFNTIDAQKPKRLHVCAEH